MVQPDAAPLEAGASVLLPDGEVGKLVKTVGKGKWVVRVEGEEKTKVVPTESLRRHVPKAAKLDLGAGAPPARYCIVGTWDDWEEHEMAWNAEKTCFEHEVAVGAAGVESFKFLQDGSWELCVHPNCQNAGPDAAIEGPEDGGLSDDWAIQAAPGKRLTVRLFLFPDGTPLRVEWRDPQEGRTDGKTKEVHGRGQPLEEDDDRGEDNLEPAAEADILAEERAARQRLVDRLERELALEDDSQAREQEEDLKARLERNRRRYDRGPDLHSLIDPGYAQKKLPTAPGPAAPPTGTCMECGCTTAVYWDLKAYCCDPCMEDFQKIVQEGWDGSLDINGMLASARAEKLQKDLGYSPQEARIALMRAFSHCFMRPGARTPAANAAPVGPQVLRR